MFGYPKRTTGESVIDYINVGNAKLVAFTLVLGFIGYHGILHLRYGSDSCTWLLSSGRYKGDHEWQPYGCMLHKYSKTDARRCLRYLAFWGKYNSFVFIGDSRLQQLYEYFIDLLKTRLDHDKSYSLTDQHAPNYTYIDNKLQLSVKFIWSPDVSRTMVDQFRAWERSEKPPSLIVASAGLEIMKTRNTTDLVLAEYKRNVTRIVQAVDSLSNRGVRVLWKLLEPVEDRDVEAEKYNRAAVEMLTHSATLIWSSVRAVYAGAGEGAGAGLPPRALRHSAQILLNVHCNDHMNYNDGSCCAAPEPGTAVQMATFAVFTLCAVLASCKKLWAWSQTFQQKREGYSLVAPPQPQKECVVSAISRLGMIMAYFYLCDRTNLFMKENKYYSEWSFWLPVGYVFALGLFFSEDSRQTRVLHREQTYEWKGWMQAVILASQVTGAGKVIPLYMLVRVAVSAYLFCTGFGHLHYTWTTADTSLIRYFRVIFRLNFLTIVLCLTMNRPYQFYSFVPLVSFWYTLMFVIFVLPPRLGAAGAAEGPYQLLARAAKSAGLLAIVTVLYMSEVFFQKIFLTRPWKALFVNSDDDIHQWWLLWKQDRYSMTYGIIFGTAYLLAQRFNLLDDNNHSNLLPPGAALSATLAAFCGIGSYVTFTFFCNNTFDCNEIHSYVAFVPIVSYIILRNVSGALRTRHSSLFAWIGTFTLELFVSQSHIWLAADTHGVLVLIPGAPVLNLIVTSFIFILTSHELNKLTNVILPYAVPDDWRLVLRNLAIFLAILIPIGIHDGMF